MTKLHYILQSKVNSRISDTLIDGTHIKVGAYVYVQTSKRPFGKTLKRSLINEAKQERILIYG